MLSGIILIIVQQLFFIPYLIETNFLFQTASDESHSLMVGIAFFTFFLSVPCTIWNVSMTKENKKKKDYVGTAFAIMAVAFGLGFLIFDYVTRIHGNGATVF